MSPSLLTYRKSRRKQKASLQQQQLIIDNTTTDYARKIDRRLEIDTDVRNKNYKS